MATSDSSLKDKGKGLAVKSGTQATTYGIKEVSSKVEAASIKAAEKARNKAIEEVVAQSEYVHIAGAIGRKSAMEKTGERVLVKASEKTMEKSLSSQGAKLGAQAAGKGVGTGAKLIKGAGTPWQLGSVAAEFGAEAIASAAGANKTVQTVTGKVVGVTSSAAIGAAVAGPVGAAGAVAIWAVGEGISQAVDAIVEANTYAPVAPCDPVEATPMCDKCFTSMSIPVCAKDGLNLCSNCSAYY